MKLSYLLLFASLLMAVGGWGSSFQSWSEAAHPSHFFSLLGVVGGVILAWIGKSPITVQPAKILPIIFVGLLLLWPMPAQAEVGDFVGAGLAWNQLAAPQINGNLFYAHPILDEQGLYSFNLIDITSQTLRPFKVMTSITTGLAQRIRTIGAVKVYGLVTGGVSAGGQNIGGTYSMGGSGIVPIGKKGWCVMVSAQVMKTTISEFQGIYGVAIGWGQQK